MLYLVIECRSTKWTCYVHPYILMYSSNAFLFMLQVHIRAFLPNRPCQHNTRQCTLMTMVMTPRVQSEIPAGGCSYIYLVGDFSFSRLPEDEQLLVAPFVMRTLCMAAPRGRGGHCDLTALLWIP